MKREKIKARPIIIRHLPTYQRGKRLYRTAKAAARAEAWAMICARYCDSVAKLSEIKELNGSTCECDWDVHGCGSADCPIHDRQRGYFARLNARLMRFLLAGTEVP